MKKLFESRKKIYFRMAMWLTLLFSNRVNYEFFPKVTNHFSLNFL